LPPDGIRHGQPLVAADLGVATAGDVAGADRPPPEEPPVVTVPPPPPMEIVPPLVSPMRVPTSAVMSIDGRHVLRRHPNGQ
jgi:hypothetical protein